jgi:hypothetical protein
MANGLAVAVILLIVLIMVGIGLIFCGTKYGITKFRRNGNGNEDSTHLDGTQYEEMSS